MRPLELRSLQALTSAGIPLLSGFHSIRVLSLGPRDAPCRAIDAAYREYCSIFYFWICIAAESESDAAAVAQHRGGAYSARIDLAGAVYFSWRDSGGRSDDSGHSMETRPVARMEPDSGDFPRDLLCGVDFVRFAFPAVDEPAAREASAAAWGSLSDRVLRLRGACGRCAAPDAESFHRDFSAHAAVGVEHGAVVGEARRMDRGIAGGDCGGDCVRFPAAPAHRGIAAAPRRNPRQSFRLRCLITVLRT